MTGKTFIKNIPAFFAGSDGIALENITQRFANEIQLQRQGAFTVPMAIENIQRNVSLLIDKYIKEPEERTRLFNAIDTIPAVGRKQIGHSLDAI